MELPKMRKIARGGGSFKRFYYCRRHLRSDGALAVVGEFVLL